MVLSLGFSHEVKYKVPKEITVKVEKQTKIHITGIDKELVSKVSSEIKAIKPVEPYKGKGIKEKDQYVLRKEGKKNKYEKLNSNQKRIIRNRKKLKKVTVDRYRITVAKSLKNISAQIIDDKINKTIASASSTEKEVKKIKKIKLVYQLLLVKC